VKRAVWAFSFLFLFLAVCLPLTAQTQQTIRVNAGGTAYRDTKSQLWSADYGFNTGSLSNSALSATVTGTTDPTLFKSARVGTASGADLQYQFAAVNGMYLVNLYFAETYYDSAGKRVFDVQIQGATLFSALDIFAQAGRNHALVKSAQVSVTNGQLVIRFAHRTNANVPIISAIEILPSGTSTAPSVTTQPASQSISPGQPATFKVVASGTAPISYQWQKNGTAISGATAAIYTTPATTSADNGETFRVVIRNSVGSVTSSSATLSIASALVAPLVISQPVSQNVAAGQPATFSVTANGSAPLAYQWMKNGSNISGANGTSYTTPPTTTTENGTTFAVALSNSVGRTTSQAATLSVASGPAVTVNWTDVHQVIDGFGASSAATGDGITDSQADLFWSTTSGVGLSLLRVQIQSDGTFPDVATMQKAKARGVTIWGTPWSPPASMKTNGSTVNGGNLLANDYQAWADYLTNYVLQLKNTYGVNLYALSVQNEPNWTASWDSCIWTGQNFHDFLGNNLIPDFTKNGITTKIMMPEETGWFFDMATATLNDPTTAAGVSIIAAHNYDGAAAAPYPLGQGLGKKLWETEVSTTDSYDGSIGNGLYWGQKINDFMTVASANAWHYWVLVNPGTSDNGGLMGPSNEATKRLYVMGNFSKFVRPGYYRIGTSGSPVSGVSISAYKDPSSGKFAIVAINHNSSQVTLDYVLNGFTANTITPWVTSGTYNLAAQPSIQVGGNSFSATLPASSVTTLVGP
jgi:glucuronoarabinoxylan endo-1,4-beta-xylanase